MPLDKTRLVEFLRIVDEAMQARITICAAGGTAMTLLDVKPSTIDIDFTIPHKDKALFEHALAATPHGFKIDMWPDGLVFCQQLPPDYLSRAIFIESFESITLKALHPVDIVVTKAGRLDGRDVQDIKACIDAFHITSRQVKERAAVVDYIGNERLYKLNVEYIIDHFFNC